MSETAWVLRPRLLPRLDSLSHSPLGLRARTVHKCKFQYTAAAGAIVGGAREAYLIAVVPILFDATTTSYW